MNKWHELAKLTPNFHDETWTVYNPLEKRKVNIPSETLAEYVAGGGKLYDLLDEDLKMVGIVDIELDLDPDIEDWINHGWDQSLYYYASSRDIDYIDSDLDKSKRNDSIENEINRYLKNEHYPKPIRKEVDIVLNKGRVKKHQLGWALENRSCTDPMEAVIDFNLIDLGAFLQNALGFMRRNYLPNKKDEIEKSNVMDTFGRPFRIYIINYGIKDLEQGIYLYDLIEHGLSVERTGDFRDIVVDCLIGHKSSKNSAFSLAIVADLKIWQWYYRHERALRNLYIDAGILMQSLLLNATVFGLRTHITPASHDSLFEDLLDLETIDEQVFYTLTVG